MPVLPGAESDPDRVTVFPDHRPAANPVQQHRSGYVVHEEQIAAAAEHEVRFRVETHVSEGLCRLDALQAMGPGSDAEGVEGGEIDRRWRAHASERFAMARTASPTSPGPR